MTNNPLVGSWRLVAFETRSADNEVDYPFGEQPLGYLLYNEQGYISVVFMAPNRPSFLAGDINGTAEEKALAYDTCRAYCGTYEITGEKVLHHIEVSVFPNWVGITQERFYELRDNRLSLSTPLFLNRGQQRTSHLIWERT